MNHLKGETKTMKRALLMLATVTMVVWAGGLAMNPLSAGEANLRVATLDVQGMTCGGCAISVKAVVKRIDGVRDAEVSWKDGRAIVTYETGTVEPETIARTIDEKLTYKARVVKDEPKG